MLAKYVRANRTISPETADHMQREIAYLARLQSAISDRIAFLADSLTDANSVSFVHVGVVEEVDKELLAEDGEAYCVKVRNPRTGRVEYLQKSQLRR